MYSRAYMYGQLISEQFSHFPVGLSKTVQTYRPIICINQIQQQTRSTIYYCSLNSKTISSNHFQTYRHKMTGDAIIIINSRHTYNLRVKCSNLQASVILMLQLQQARWPMCKLNNYNSLLFSLCRACVGLFRTAEVLLHYVCRWFFDNVV